MTDSNYQGFTHRYANTIQAHPVRLYYEKPVMLSLLENMAGKRVLDAGCGAGEYAEWLLNQGASVTAFDLMPEFVAMTHQRTQGKAHVVQADLSQPLAFAQPDSFDGVVSSLVLHYIADWAGVFAEIKRILAPNGRFIFSCMHPMTDLNAVDNHRGYFTTQLYESVWRNFGEPYPILKMYHRPLEAVVTPLLESGLVLEKMIEPQPAPAMRTVAPQEYASLMQQPVFLFVVARKAV